MNLFRLTPLLFIFLSLSCTSEKLTQQPLDLTKKMSTDVTTSCQLIEKEFVNKGGKVTEYKELYLRCSVQDYFIKLCEGNVTRKELEPYINSGITVKMEVRDGMLDHCDPNPSYAQSRTGIYAVILSIEK